MSDDNRTIVEGKGKWDDEHFRALFSGFDANPHPTLSVIVCRGVENRRENLTIMLLAPPGDAVTVRRTSNKHFDKSLACSLH